MDMITAITVLLVFFALGDVVAKLTGGTISMVLFTSLAFLVAFWLGLPVSIFDDSNLLAIGTFMVGLMITSLGTMLDFKQLKEQWKAALTSLLAVSAIAVVLYFVGSLLVGREMALVSSPIIAGGSAATIIITSELEQMGLSAIAVFAVLVYVTQKFVGIPVASAMLKKEARRIVKEMELNPVSAEKEKTAAEGQDVPTKKSLKFFPAFSKDLQTPFILLAKLSLVVVLCQQIGNWTGISVFILYLVLGVVFAEIGFLEKDILKKSGSHGFVIFITMCVIFTNLSQATPDMILSYLPSLITVLLLGVVSVTIVSLSTAKLFKMTPAMAIAVGTSCFFGFPTTYYLPYEIATAVGKNEEEKEAIIAHTLPKMLVAGFVSVTLVSVILAGIVIDFL